MVYPIEKLIIPPIYKLWLGKVNGLDNVPKDKPFIIAANHTSYYDVLLLPILMVPHTNKKIHAFVNSSYWKPFLTRIFLDYWEQIPVFFKKEKNSEGKNQIAFKKALNYLKNGELIMIFPEGTRSTDGKLKKAYTGVARLALQSKVPVLPVGIINSHKVLPKGRILPRFAKCDVKIGKPLVFEKHYNKNIKDKLLRAITRDVMKQTAKLIGQKYKY